MKTEEFMFAGCKGVNLAATIWQPDGEIKAVLQVAHGMTEHMGCYERLGAYLCHQGGAVAGFDLRGHGRNGDGSEVASCGEGGWEASIEDMHLFFEELDQRFPKVPHHMLGFSLGSFLLREYLGRYPDGIASAVLVGTGYQPGWLLSIIMGIAKGQIKKVGFDGTSDLVRQLSFGTYNQKFKPNRTTADWLCSDEAEVDRYLADPLVRKAVSAGLFWELFGSMKRSGKTCGSDTVPILMLSGKKDAVGNFGKGVEAMYSHMKKKGMENVTLRLFENARHDLFHEESTGVAETVRRCIGEWLHP